MGPYTVEEIVREAKSAVDAGAAIVHLHVREDDGTPTQSKARFKTCIDAIYEVCPDVILIPSTGGVGAADDLASGQSTFMVEMNEVAYILKNATKKSLLIFDEIGRGTSTYDGMSIARAVLEYVAKKIKAKSLFATHYHELVALESTVEGVKNFNVAAKKRGNTITFLRKIVPGGTDDSYGIDVARLAGVPEVVIDRAQEVLKEIESEQPKVVIKREEKNEEPDLFNAVASDEITERLKNIDPTVLTPIEAMNELYALVQKAKNQ